MQEIPVERFGGINVDTEQRSQRQLENYRVCLNAVVVPIRVAGVVVMLVVRLERER